MKIKIKGKTWKQITPKEFRESKETTAMFIDYKYDEKTYFKQVLEVEDIGEVKNE